jgi:hypothetical protein
MTRLSFGALGTVLLILWVIGLATHGNGWVVWGDFVVGAISFVVAVGPVFTGDYYNRDSAPYAFGLSIALVLLFFASLALGGAIWLGVLSLVVACAYLGVGLWFERARRYGF